MIDILMSVDDTIDGAFFLYNTILTPVGSGPRD